MDKIVPIHKNLKPVTYYLELVHYPDSRLSMQVVGLEDTKNNRRAVLWALQEMAKVYAKEFEHERPEDNEN